MNNFPAINQKNLKPIKDDAMSNLRKNVQRQLANQRAYDKNYKNLGKINPQPAEPAPPTEIKGINSKRTVEDIYVSEFESLLGPYIGDVDFLNSIIVKLNEDQMKEIVLNWDTIKPQIDKLKGTRIEQSKFIDLLEDFVAESMFKKGKLTRLQQEQNINRRRQETNNDYDLYDTYDNTNTKDQEFTENPMITKQKPQSADETIEMNKTRKALKKLTAEQMQQIVINN
jgi:hypothetical protein